MINRITSMLLDWVPKFLLLLWTWLSPASTAILGIVFLTIIDTILGVKASLTQNIPFSSRKLSEIVSKITTYSLGIIATHILQTLFINDLGFNIFKFAIFIFASIELVSIYENISIILGMDIIKIFKNLLKRTGVVKNILRDTVMDIKTEQSKSKKRGVPKKK